MTAGTDLEQDEDSHEDCRSDVDRGQRQRRIGWWSCGCADERKADETLRITNHSKMNPTGIYLLQVPYLGRSCFWKVDVSLFEHKRDGSREVTTLLFVIISRVRTGWLRNRKIFQNPYLTFPAKLVPTETNNDEPAGESNTNNRAGPRTAVGRRAAAEAHPHVVRVRRRLGVVWCASTRRSWASRCAFGPVLGRRSSWRGRSTYPPDSGRRR